MDVLSNVLRAVRLCGSVFFTAEFSAPWALESPNPDLLATIVMPEAEHVSLFHILIEGHASCNAARTGASRLNPGMSSSFLTDTRIRCAAMRTRGRRASITCCHSPSPTRCRRSPSGATGERPALSAVT